MTALDWQPSSGWSLQWSDEFNGPSIDLNNWVYDTGANGWGNNEWENYTTDPANSFISNGMLVIKAIQTTGGAGILAPGSSAEIQGRIYRSDWANFDASTWYSYNPSTSYVNWNKVNGAKWFLLH